MLEKQTLINDLEVNFKISGEGKTSPSTGRQVLILHGWGGSSDSWIDVQNRLSSQGFKVICPDFPGFGKSKTPPKPWSVRDYMKWMVSFIDFLNLDRFFLIAHSFGGRIAVKFANNYPERIEKLILCASAGIKQNPSFKTRVLFWIAKTGNMLFTPKILRRLKDRARSIFYIFLRNRDYAKANSTMKKTIIKVLEEDLLPDLAGINAKTLLIWGEGDKMVPVKYAEIFRENIKNSKLEILPKISHSPHLEVPEKLSEIIIQFLKS